MRIFFFFSLTVFQALNADVLKVTVPYNGPITKDEPIQNEMILPPILGSLKTDSLKPIFGETRDTEIFFNDIPLNDPSAPRGMADLQYLKFGRALVREGGVFNLSSDEVPGRIALSNLGPDIRFSLPHQISPFVALSSQSFQNSGARWRLNAGVKGTFSLDETMVDFSLLKIKGENKYKEHGFLKTSTADQNGASIKIVSSKCVFISLKHMDIQRNYGDIKISGQTDMVEVGAFLTPHASVSFKVLEEKDQDQNRTLPFFTWKNENLSLGMSFLEKEIYPEFSTYFGNKTLFFEAIAKKRPPKLSELTIDYETTPKNWVKIKSDLTSETLFGARAGWTNGTFDIQGGTDFLICPILYDYETYQNFNGPNWGKPFVKTGFRIEGAYFGYKYTSPNFITHPSQMINVPVHHFNWTWDFNMDHMKIHASIDICPLIKRYDEETKSIVGNGYESRFGLQIDHKPFFIKLDIISADPSQMNNDLFIFSAGVHIDAL